MKSGTLRKEHAGQTVVLNGWVQKQRDFGELVFVDLRDRSGICQVLVDRARGASEELLAAAKEVRSEFVVRVEGTVVERADSQKNPKLPTGDIEVMATSITILNRADTPPLMLDAESNATEAQRI